MLKVYVVPEDDSKKAKAKAWIKNRWTDVKCFWADNKQEIITLVPVIVGGVTVLVKFISKHSAISQEKKVKELYVWDAKTGGWFELRKKLTGEQRLELERRKELGEPVGSILASMKVLKM